MTSRHDPPAPSALNDATADATADAAAGAAPDALEERLREALLPNLLLVRLIGAGGMARVFLAREPALKRMIAVKVLSGDLAASAEARARFEREAQAVASLSHPNIVAVHGVGELPDGTPYFVMQHVAGRSMGARVDAEGPLPVAEARRALGEVAAALATAHEQGIIHRDIKPANILYEETTGRSLVSDFGIAAIAPKGEVRSTRLTSTGMLVGTPMYMSPEQLLAEPVSEKTDIYSLGLLAHELLAGSGPFTGTTPNELIAAHLRDTPKRLAERNPDVDAELDELVSRCLEKDAAKRPTAQEIARRLTPGGGALLEWPPPGLEELHGRLRRLSKTYWLGGGLVLTAMLSIVAAGPRIGSALFSPLSLLLLLAAMAGVLLLAVAIRRTLSVGGESARAIRSGYAWMTVLETLADHKGDTGNLVSGSREYAALRSQQRSQFRVRRATRESLLFAGGFAAVPILATILILGSSGLVGPNAIWASVALPGAAAIAALVLEARERRAFFARRRKRATAQTPDPSKLSGPWYVSFEAVRLDQPLGRGASGSPDVGRGSAIAASVFLVVMIALLVPLLLIGTLGPSFWAVIIPKFANTRSKVEIAETTRPYEVASDPAITPIEAGRALYALFKASDSAAKSAFAERPAPTPALEPPPWREPLPAGLFPTSRPDWVPGLPSVGNMKIIEASRHGFSPAEMAYLRRIAGASQWRYMETVARARFVDYLGARFVIPFEGSAGGYWAFPIPRIASTKELAYASASRAAYYLARGQRDSAEAALRHVVSFGFAFVDNGTTLIDQLIGMVIVAIGRQYLLEMFKVTGDPRGARLQAKVDSVVTAIESRTTEAGDASSTIDVRDPVAARRAVRQIAQDPKEMRGLRLEMIELLAATPCTNARELVFGPDPDVRQSFERARRSFARFASDSAMLDLVYRTPELLESMVATSLAANPWTNTTRSRVLVRAARLGGLLLRNPRLPGCSAMLLLMSS